MNDILTYILTYIDDLASLLDFGIVISSLSLLCVAGFISWLARGARS